MTLYDGLLAFGALVACIAAGFFIGRLAHVVLRRVASRTSVAWDDTVVGVVRSPLMFGAFVLALEIALSVAPLAPSVARVGKEVAAALVYVAIFFLLVRIVDAGRTALEQSGALERREALSLVQIGGRILKVAILAVCALALLAHFGFSVATLVAGLGLGGLAIGLAAQKTLENMFGALSLALDRPLRAGDFIKVGDHIGTVETIGLRSTAIRTLDRTLVSVPNGDLANARIENYAVRDRIRLACTIGLVYSTSPAAMRRILADLEKVLREHPKIWPDAIVVRFSSFGASSLDIEIMAWFQVTEWSDFQLVRQDVLLSFMEVVERAGSSFAFPSRTLYVEAVAAAPPRGGG